MAIFTLGVGLDNFTGTADADLFVLNSAAHFQENDFIVGGAGADTLRFAGASGTLILDERIEGIEFVALTGAAAIHVNAAEALNALTFTGNAAAWTATAATA